MRGWLVFPTPPDMMYIIEKGPISFKKSADLTAKQSLLKLS